MSGSSPLGSPRSPGMDAERSRAWVGPYRLVERLGEGGMGTVWLAEQTEPVRRQVALKLVRADMDGDEVLARFETERRVLALMSHPNVAQVFDAGTAGGHPYIAMEYVPGLPVTEFSDERELGLDARLRLFVQVCRGVHHAHQKGILHRDLKPSNVLVEVVDGVPVPKIIDFGVAKAMQPLPGAELLAERGRLIGTPAYMSPELAEISPLGADSRADVFSLGVLLHELLVGDLPFEEAPLSLDLPRNIRERTPARPSSRCTKGNELAARRAAQRSETPRRLRRRLRGDLDWIVLRALQRDPERRYASASELAQDVERHLAHEPVAAAPANALYRARKFLRRNRVAVVAVALVVASLAAGLTAALVETREAQESAALARESQERAERSAVEARENLARAQAAELDARSALERERVALDQANGRRLAAQAMTRALEAPTTALLLAIESAELAPGEEATAALYAALEHDRLIAQWDGHDGPIRCLALSPGGERLISGDDSGLVLLRDARSGAIQARLDAHTELVEDVGFTPDGASAWSCSHDGLAIVWDVQRGAERLRVPHPAALSQGLVSPDGKTLLTACADGGVRAIELATGKVRVVDQHAGGAFLVRASLEPRLFASGGDSGEVLLVRDFDGLDRAPLRIEMPPLDPGPWPPPRADLQVSFASASELLTRGPDGHAILWDAASGVERSRLSSADRRCDAAQLAPDGRTALVRWRLSEDERRAEVLDLRGGAPPVVLRGLDNGGLGRSSTTISADGTIALVELGEQIGAWDMRLGLLRGRLIGSVHGNYAPVLRSDGRVLAGGHDGFVRVFGLSALREEWTVAGLAAQAGVIVPAFGPDGEVAVAARAAEGAGGARVCDLVDVPSGRRLFEVLGPQPGEVHAAFEPGGALLALAGEFGLRVWDLVARRVVFEHSGPRSWPAFAWGGAWLAVTSGANVEVIEVATGRVIAALPYDGQHAEPAPDGQSLVTADGARNTASVWSLPEGELLHRNRHTAFVFDARFDPRGERIASFANDTSVLIADPRTHAIVRSIDRLPTSDHAKLAWSPDARWIGVACDHDLLLLDASTTSIQAVWRSMDGAPLRREFAFTPDGETFLATFEPYIARFLPLDPLAYARRHAPRRLTAAEMELFSIGTAEERAARNLELTGEMTSAQRLLRAARFALEDGDWQLALDVAERASVLRARPAEGLAIVRARALAQRHASRAGSFESSAEPADAELSRELDEIAASLRQALAAGEAAREDLKMLPELVPLLSLPELREFAD